MNLSTATTFEAAAAAATMAVYLAVGTGVWLRAPRDARAQTFLAAALAGLAPYVMTILVWRDRVDEVMTSGFIAFLSASLALSSVALFHFMQVFPVRRPWIGRHAGWLVAAYAVLPIVSAGLGIAVTKFVVSGMASLANTGSGGLGASVEGGSEAVIEALLLLPLVAIVLILLPCAGLVSIFKSWKTSTAAGRRAAAWTSGWILVSQLAGGALSIVIVPLLSTVAPEGPLASGAAALLFGFGLMMPIVFAWGVWRLGVLDVS